MTEDHREQSFRIGAGSGELVGMADAGCLDLDQYLASLGAFRSTSSITNGCPAA